MVLGYLSDRPWWLGLILIGAAVMLFGLIVFASFLVKPRGGGKSFTDREFDTRQEIDSRFMTNTGDRVDFEADQRKPRY